MTQTLTIALTETEMKLLRKHAALDCRRPQEQARYFLRNVLMNESSAEMNKPAIAESLATRSNNGFGIGNPS